MKLEVSRSEMKEIEKWEDREGEENIWKKSSREWWDQHMLSLRVFWSKWDFITQSDRKAKENHQKETSRSENRRFMDHSDWNFHRNLPEDFCFPKEKPTSLNDVEFLFLYSYIDGTQEKDKPKDNTPQHHRQTKRRTSFHDRHWPDAHQPRQEVFERFEEHLSEKQIAKQGIKSTGRSYSGNEHEFSRGRHRRREKELQFQWRINQHLPSTYRLDGNPISHLWSREPAKPKEFEFKFESKGRGMQRSYKGNLQ